MFQGSRVVITDRLHAHILATLMGIPNVAMDNDYGKIEGIYSNYTGRFSTAHFAQDEAQLISTVNSLLKEDRP